ncbi:type II toxin-antitoxin system VapC family toxin [Candidatus Woesearchaeota archaeon]|nr:type II toxin-antitoxin system VapC family toxin [Candidatus Woesearchaeota archaeon]
MGTYLDSNIFIYAFANDDEIGERCRKLLKGIIEGSETAVTSSLTFNECFFVIRREKGFDEAMKFSDLLLRMPNLRISDVNVRIIFGALNVLKKYRLAPGDAVHAATAIDEQCKQFYSTDKDFDKVKEIARKLP